MSIPERFTDDSRKAMAMAYRESLRLDSEYIGTEHILLGLLAEGKGHAAQALGGRGVDIEKARREVDKMARDVGPELGYADDHRYRCRTRRLGGVLAQFNLRCCMW